MSVAPGLSAILAVGSAPLYGYAASRASARLAGGRTCSALTMTVAALVLAVVGWLAAPGLLVVSTLLGWALLLLAVVDVKAYRLPDVLTLPLGLVGFLVPGAPAGEPDRLAGAAAGFLALFGLDLIYRRLRGRSGMGLGDAKLLAAAGAWLGIERLAAVLLLASAGGLAWAAARVLLRGRRELERPLPYGAPLCAAFWVIWLAS